MDKTRAAYILHMLGNVGHSEKDLLTTEPTPSQLREAVKLAKRRIDLAAECFGGVWAEITEGEEVPEGVFFIMCGIRDGKTIVGPMLAYRHGDMYYDEWGLGYAWMTHYREVDIPPLPTKAMSGHKLEG
jgi:hypothetical protein